MTKYGFPGITFSVLLLVGMTAAGCSETGLSIDSSENSLSLNQTKQFGSDSGQLSKPSVQTFLPGAVFNRVPKA